jgi:hypothetical protein
MTLSEASLMLHSTVIDPSLRFPDRWLNLQFRVDDVDTVDVQTPHI